MQNPLYVITKKKTFPLLFALFLLYSAQSQPSKTDSLLNALKTHVSYKQKANTLYELSVSYQRSNLDSVYSYAKQLYALATEHKDQANITKAEMMIAFYFSNVGKAAEALMLCEKNLALLEKDSSDLPLLGKLHRLTGVCLMRLNKQKEAVAHFYSSMKIAEKLKSDADVIISINNIGWAYMELNQYEKAIREFNKAIRAVSAVKDFTPNSLSVIYNNLASCYGALHKMDSAYKYTNSSVEISLKNKDYATAANGLNIIASILTEDKKYNQALEKLLQAKEFREKTGDPFFIVSDMAQLAQLYAVMGKHNEGIKTSKEALTFAKENKLDAKIPLIYLVLAKNYEAANNYKEAALTYKELNKIKDTLYEKASAEALAQMQAQYETEQKENEIQNLKQQQKINALQLQEKTLSVQKQNYLLISLALLTLLLAATGFFYIRYQRHQRLLAVRETEEKERQRMAKDIHDDLGSGLSKIKFMSEVLFSKANNNAEILSGINSISETSIALVDNMRDLIWTMNSDNARLDGLVARIREYSNNYLNDTDKQLILNISDNVPAQKINTEAHRNILFIAKEALQNIVKHSNANRVEIYIDVKTDEFQLSIADNGTDIKENHSGNGLQNMKQRAGSIGGSFSLSSSNGGVKINLSVPLSKLLKV